MTRRLFDSFRATGWVLIVDEKGVVTYEYDGVEFSMPEQAAVDLEDLLTAMKNTAPDDGGPSGACCEDLCDVCLTRETVIITIVHALKLLANGLLEIKKVET